MWRWKNHWEPASALRFPTIWVDRQESFRNLGQLVKSCLYKDQLETVPCFKEPHSSPCNRDPSQLTWSTNKLNITRLCDWCIMHCPGIIRGLFVGFMILIEPGETVLNLLVAPLQHLKQLPLHPPEATLERLVAEELHHKNRGATIGLYIN